MMPQPQLTPEQRDILAEVGHYHLMLETHQTAARFCKTQLKQLRERLVEQEPPALQSQQDS